MSGTGIHQRRDTALSEHGRKQAETLTKRFKGSGVELVLSSRYDRASETARMIGKKLGRRVVRTALLDEWRIPTEMEDKHFMSKRAHDFLMLQRERIDDDRWHYSDEENTYDLKRRAGRLVRYLSARKEESAIAVTHTAVINMLVALAVFGDGMTGTDFLRFKKVFHPENASVTEVEIEDGSVKVLTFNDRAGSRYEA